MSIVTKITLYGAAALLSLSIAGVGASPSSAHAQTPQSRLSPRARVAFLVVLPAVQSCRTDVTAIAADIQDVQANLSAGSADTGTLGPDAAHMRYDCLAAAARVRRIVVDQDRIAQRVKAELVAGLVDMAQGAGAAQALAQDIDALNVSAARADMNRATVAWTAAASHLRVATSYLR